MYEPVIGLEVHAQLLTQTKMFCDAPNAFGSSPNTNISPVSLGLPGSLPVPNAAAIDMAVQAGLALDCEVRELSRFARKHYFYPDLPKGYQISQFDEPLNEHGHLDIEVDGVTKRIGITRIHVEEDAAKNIHGVAGGTIVDYNRAGTPLIEIVSEPDFRNAEEVEAYLKKLRELLMAIGVNDGNLEEGSFRCDANVSIRPVGREKFGTRTELKNINSFRFVKKAIEYEITRQEAVLTSGGEVVQETRTWSESQGKTITMRKKEEAHDYRYFPCPDLPALIVSKERIAKLRETLPELPVATRARWQADYGLTEYDATVLSAHPKTSAYFEAIASGLGKGKGKKAANFMQSEVLRYVSVSGLDASFPVSSDAIVELLSLVEAGTISGRTAKEVFAEMVDTGRGAQRIVDEKGLAQVSDSGAIEAEVQKVIDANPDKVSKYRAGKVNLLGFFMGQVMKATKGQANPGVVKETLAKLLGPVAE